MGTMERILRLMAEKQASDVYLSAHAPAQIRLHGQCVPINAQLLPPDAPLKLLAEVLPAARVAELEATGELNMGLALEGVGTFRFSAMRQRGSYAAVVRFIPPDVPALASLNLPEVLSALVMEKRGLILVSGQTGSGKSTSLAAMVGHRNTYGQGHIITVEDPIEFVHHHKNCIITQRDVGLDTYSYSLALKNALRQRPDLVVIGEVRDREVMEQAIYFAETGHLCIATIHANNASQTIERVLNFFPEERHPQILLNLSLNLRATLSQRLLNTMDGKRTLALEIMLNRGLIKQHIEQGKIRQLREMIEKGTGEGMQSFDQHLFQLYHQRLISEETALAESESAANLRVMFQNKKMIDRGFDVSLRDEAPIHPGTF